MLARLSLEGQDTGSALPLRAQPFGAIASNVRYEYPASLAGIVFTDLSTADQTLDADGLANAE